MADRNKDEEYERMLEQAVSKIAVYTDEWTNHLPSDPGITILENLTAFQLLLLQRIRSIPETVRPVLPGLLGIEPLEGACARVLLGAYDLCGSRTFGRHEKFYLGELCFETVREIHLPEGRMRKVYRKHQGRLEEIEELRAGNPLAAPIFGEQPQAGDTIYLLFDGPYGEADKEVQLYVNARPAFLRNPPDADYPVSYADIRWSYYTEEGYQDAKCRDETNAFLRSGEQRIRLGASPPALGSIMGEEGYLLRCELLHEEYDQIPRVRQIEGPLFEVYEMDSKAVSYELPYEDSRELLDRMGALCRNDDDRYLFVYIGNNKDGYRECRKAEAALDLDGCAEREALLPQSVKMIYMGREMAVQKQLGTLYGYDNQEFELSLPGEAVPGSLEIMVEKGSGEGQRSFFFHPLQDGVGEVRYEYDSRKKVLRILDAGDYEGDQAAISSYAIFHGADGNVLPGNRFLRPEGDKRELYQNPARGTGGRMQEGLEETAARMKKQLLLPGALVTAADYEQAVSHVPDLCIQKVHACQGEGNREVQIFVKPYGENKMSGLSRLYVRQIQKYLEDRRLLGAKISIAGPECIPIDVHAVIAVKVQYADARKEIENAIRQELDDINEGQSFCGIVSRHRILQALERMPCIEYIQDLILSQTGNQNHLPGKPPSGAGIGSMDIKLPAGGICYAGKVELALKRSSII